MAITYTQPLYPFLLGLVFVMTLVFWLRQRNRPTLFLFLGVLALSAISWPPAAWLASWSVEAEYRSGANHFTLAEEVDEEIGAIVVLSAGVRVRQPGEPYSYGDDSTYKRCQHALWLYQSWRELPILVTGGSGSEPLPEGSVARVMANFLEANGVASGDLWLEEKASSTYENALFSAEILREHDVKKVIVVTQAFHMRRAELCFLNQGIEVVPAPCDFRTCETKVQWQFFLLGNSAIRHCEEVLHEWVGLVWYWWKGRI